MDRPQLRFATCLTLGLVALAVWHNWRNPALKPAGLRPAPRVERRNPLGKAPLAFEINEGQTAREVKFLARSAGQRLFLASDHAVFTVGQRVVRMRLPGANGAPAIEGLDALPGRSNYFIGNDPRQWRTGVTSYRRVRYRDVYPGVDLIYYGEGQSFEFDFVVAPGADPDRIVLAFEGIDGLDLDSQGDLRIRAGGSEVRQRRPRVYQVKGGTRSELAGVYTVEPPNRVRFALGAYDRSQPLVIDPVLSFSSFLGGSSYDYPLGIAVDRFGAVYVTGYTRSDDFPGTPLAPPGGPFENVFVTKLDSTGSRVIYSTYFGGRLGNNSSTGIAVDELGNAYITGYTSSSTFPTTSGAVQQKFAGSGWTDAFVTKLNETGSALVYSTYLGGSGRDEGHGIAVDRLGNAFITGNTFSNDFPLVNPVQGRTASSRADAFVAKINSLGSALAHSTYLGGSGDDYGYGISLDLSGNAYVAGITESTDFPTTPGAFSQRHSGGVDAFVASIAANGGSLVYATYLGGTGNDYAYAIATDSRGNAYITGNSDSIDFPTTAGVVQPRGGGGSDVIVAKLNRTGDALVYSTYLGGAGTESGHRIAVDASGNAYVTGYTYSVDFPTANALQASLASFGVVKSTDRGATWQASNAGLPAADVNALALDPTDPATLYAGTSGAGVFKTSDAGMTWSPANEGLTARDVFALTFDASAATLYAGTQLGVSASTDGGRSWTDLLTGVAVRSLAVDPLVPAVLYAGGSGVLKSTDAGASWNKTGLNGAVVNSLSVDPRDSSTIYEAGNGGVSMTRDGGEKWVGLIASQYPSIYRISGYVVAVDPQDPTTVFAGLNGSIARSSSGGASWEYARLQVNTYALAIDPMNPYRVYAGTSGGFFASGDGGGTWAGPIAGLTNTIRALVVSPADPATLYAGVTVDSDAFVAKLDPNAASLVYSTYLGGFGRDQAGAIAVDSSGNAYVAGYTSSSNFPTMNPLQGSFGGVFDAFIVKLTEP
jgi:hypothetical protein